MNQLTIYVLALCFVNSLNGLEQGPVVQFIKRHGHGGNQQPVSLAAKLELVDDLDTAHQFHDSHSGGLDPYHHAAITGYALHSGGIGGNPFYTGSNGGSNGRGQNGYFNQAFYHHPSFNGTVNGLRQLYGNGYATIYQNSYSSNSLPTGANDHANRFHNRHHQTGK